MYYKITGKQKPIRTIDAEVVENELESNKQINDLDFIFITSSHPINKKNRNHRPLSCNSIFGKR